MADLFGRRWVTISAVGIFVLGSLICATAPSANALILGRLIQGLGSGGFATLLPVIISDLVPLRKRGNLMAIILGTFAVGTALGPFIGAAIVQSVTWRWLFFINLPIGGIGLFLLFIFLHTGLDRTESRIARVKMIDIFGILILCGSSSGVLFALAYAGAEYEWSSAVILTPLLLGLSGYVVFFLYEGSAFCVRPMMPLRLFKSITAIILGINTFINSCLLIYVLFFLPVYFQAVLQSTPVESGVQLLPVILMAILGAGVTGVVLTKFGRYKLIHVSGVAISMIGVGLFSLLNPESPVVEWVIFELITATGSAMVYDSLLPAFQATTVEEDQAAATATINFIRSLGNIWGFAIPTAIFNTRVQYTLLSVDDISVRESLERGRAYQMATRDFIISLTPATRSQVIHLFTKALQVVWWVAVTIAGLEFFLALFEKEIPLRKELVTNYGLEDQDSQSEMNIHRQNIK